MKPNLRKLSKRIQSAIQTQELTSVLPDRLEVVRKNCVYAEYKDVNGEPFESFAHWLNANIPHGAGVGQCKDFVTHRQLRALCEGRKELIREIDAAIGMLKLQKHGTNRYSRVDNVNSNGKAKGGNSRDYLLQRLQRDCKREYNEVVAGNKSVRAAAIAAGIVKANGPSTATNLARAKSAWRKMTKKERDEFRKWMRTKDAKA